MSQEKYLQQIKAEVEEATINRLLDELIYASGQNPSSEALQRAQWYKMMTIREKEMLRQLVTQSVKSTTENFIDAMQTQLEKPGE